MKKFKFFKVGIAFAALGCSHSVEAMTRLSSRGMGEVKMNLDASCLARNNILVTGTESEFEAQKSIRNGESTDEVVDSRLEMKNFFRKGFKRKSLLGRSLGSDLENREAAQFDPDELNDFLRQTCSVQGPKLSETEKIIITVFDMYRKICGVVAGLQTLGAIPRK